MCIALDEMVKDGEMRGIEKINELVKLLLKEGREGDLLRSASDMEYQRQLLEEFNI